MKLELKHLASYLPYGLKFRAKAEVWEMTCLYTLDEYKVWAHNYWDKDKLLYYPALNRKSDFQSKGYRLSQIKPILRPLSDLTKEIEHNGEKFVPMDILCNEFSQYDCFEFDNVNILNNPYNQIQNLLEWHFDIYGLLENGLAIDVNTLGK